LGLLQRPVPIEAPNNHTHAPSFLLHFVDQSSPSEHSGRAPESDPFSLKTGSRRPEGMPLETRQTIAAIHLVRDRVFPFLPTAGEPVCYSYWAMREREACSTNLGEHNAAILEAEVAGLEPLNADQQKAIVKEFFELVISANSALAGFVEYTRAVLEKAVGADKAAAIVGPLETGRTERAPEGRAPMATVERMGMALQAVRSKWARTQAERSKLELDFDLGLGADAITVEVLKELIRENPVKMGRATDDWLSGLLKDEPKTETALSLLQKLAALLILSDEECASILFKHFDGHECKLAAEAMVKLPSMTIDQQKEVIEEFAALAPLKEFEARCRNPPAKLAFLPKGGELEELLAEQRKLAMDFGLQVPTEKIILEVLQELTRENPMKVIQAARIWLRSDPLLINCPFAEARLRISP